MISILWLIFKLKYFKSYFIIDVSLININYYCVNSAKLYSPYLNSNYLQFHSLYQFIQILNHPMQNTQLQQVINLLIEVKLTLQRMRLPSGSIVFQNIDTCISKLTPIAQVYDQNNHLLPDFQRSFSMDNRKDSNNLTSPKSQITMVDTNPNRLSLQDVSNSFIKQGSDHKPNQLSNNDNPLKDSVLLDYFIFKFDFTLDQYVIMGRERGEKTDRNVFLDLLTDQKKKGDIFKLQKTQSLTNILKQVYSPNRIGEPFILPNCMQSQIKYLFVFGLHECGSLHREIYKTETFCCFVSRQFILSELSQLMRSIAKICFEQRVNEASQADEQELPHVISQLHAKKTSVAITKALQSFFLNFDLSKPADEMSKLSQSQWKNNSLQSYLELSSLRWSIVKMKSKSKQQKLIPTLVLLFYFALSEYKIIMLANTLNKHIISQLSMGLLHALSPLTYTYPIVAATITNHHMQFISSPVPILISLWGDTDRYNYAKTNIKKSIKQQRDMNADELQRESLISLVDLEDNSIRFIDSVYRETCNFAEKIQTYIQSQTQGSLSRKLSLLVSQMMTAKQLPEWMSELRSKLVRTQMYEYLSNPDKKN